MTVSRKIAGNPKLFRTYQSRPLPAISGSAELITSDKQFTQPSRVAVFMVLGRDHTFRDQMSSETIDDLQ